jgi:hypothetical protein
MQYRASLLLVLSLVVLSGAAVAADRASGLAKPLQYPTGTATVKVRYAAAYPVHLSEDGNLAGSGPTETAELVGYVPGAVSIAADVVKREWVVGVVHWDYGKSADTLYKFHGKAFWFRRSDLAFAEDFVPFKGKWPLQAMILWGEFPAAGYYFPPDNRCLSRVPRDVIETMRKASDDHANKTAVSSLTRLKPGQTTLPDSQISCYELWEIPGNSLMFANPDTGINIWYDRNTGEIRVNSIADTVLFLYTDGRVETPDFGCYLNPHWIACPIIQGTKPPKTIPDKKKMQDDPG